MVRRPLVVSALMIWSFLPVTLCAQRMGGGSASEGKHLGGTVYYPGNKPADNVTVELHSAEGTLMAPATTTASGSFEFYNLNPSTYALQINQQGYRPVEVSVDLTLTSTRGIVIYLTPITEGNAERTSPSTVSAHELSMPPKARELMDTGKKKLYFDKDAQGGLEDFQRAVSIAPDYYEADYQSAVAYLALGKPNDAEKSFRKSIDVSGDKYGDADVGLGKVLLDKGDISDAEKTLRHGIELNPTSSRGFYELARAEFDEHKVDDAAKSAEQARSLSPDFPMVYRLLANIHLQKKDYTALLQDIDAYIKLDPDSPAGLRAKEMRPRVQGMLAKQSPAAPSDAKP
jgi:tetratricopeptide (TPR) repeat protein